MAAAASARRDGDRALQIVERTSDLQLAVISSDAAGRQRVLDNVRRLGFCATDATAIVQRNETAEQARQQLTAALQREANHQRVSADARMTPSLPNVAFLVVVGARPWAEESRLHESAVRVFGEAFQQAVAILLSQAGSQTAQQLQRSQFAGQIVMESSFDYTALLCRQLNRIARESGIGTRGFDAVQSERDEAFGTEQSAVENEQPPALLCYDMTGTNMGTCLIVNNNKYSERTSYDDRDGSEKDVEKLRSTFERLNFDVIVVSDVEILPLMQEFSKRDHSSMKSFVCIIMGHGDGECVVEIDGSSLPVAKIIGCFYSSQCSSLAHKPKLFFVQACRGTQEERVRIDGQENNPQSLFCPNQLDFMLSFSTIPGYVAYRNIDSGSYYVQRLCEVLDEMHPTCDLLSMLSEVNRRVSSEPISHRGRLCHQVSVLESSLTRRVFFGADKCVTESRLSEVLKEKKKLEEEMRLKCQENEKLKEEKESKDCEIKALRNKLLKIQRAAKRRSSAEEEFAKVLHSELPQPGSPLRLLLLGTQQSGRGRLCEVLAGERALVVDTPAFADWKAGIPILIDALEKHDAFDAVVMVYRIENRPGDKDIPHHEIELVRELDMYYTIFGKEVFLNSAVLVSTNEVSCVQSEMLDTEMQAVQGRLASIDIRAGCDKLQRQLQLERIFEKVAEAERLVTNSVLERLRHVANRQLRHQNTV